MNAIYFLFQFVAVQFVQQFEMTILNSQLCNRTYFMEHVGKYDEKLDFKLMAYMHKHCKKQKCKYALPRPYIRYSAFTTVTAEGGEAEGGVINLSPNTDCWGYYISFYVYGSQPFAHKYIFDETDYSLTFNFYYGKTYVVEVYNLPDPNWLKTTTLKMPEDKCEAMSWKEANLLHWPTRTYCSLPDETQIQAIATKYCDANKRVFTNKTFREQIKVDVCSIEFISPPNKSENDYAVLWGIAITSLVFVSLAFVTMVWTIRKRSRKSSIKHMSFTGVPRSILILHCPGCDVLDVFIRDLAYVLKSYNLKVKSALLEQTIIDAEGGISSFIQRNIAECNYILMVFTERTKALNFPKHRPFQFALRILGGLAFSGCNKSIFVPIYFTNYKKALKIIPPFLYPSMDNGFQLPGELKRLISTLMGRQNIDATKDQNEKIKFFTGKMKRQAQKILAEIHPACPCEGCVKGEVDYAESELWASESLSNPSTISGPLQSISNIYGSNISITQIINDKTMIRSWQTDSFGYDFFRQNPHAHNVYQQQPAEKSRFETRL